MRFTFLIMLIGVCFAQKTPGWFGQNELPGYPVKYNYTGVGEGTTFAAAQSNAQAAIASQLRVTVGSTVETFVQDMETDDRSAYLEVFRQSTKSTVNETVKGIEIVRNQKVKNSYYVFAVLNKARFLAGLKVELDQLWGRTIKLVRDARNYVNEGRIFVALENYTDAQEFVVPFYTKKAFYDALSPVPFFISETVTISDMVSEIRGILTGVNIEVVSGNKQSAKAGTLLREPVTFHVYYKKAGTDKKISIPNMPLTVKYEDGTVIERGSTNQNGIVETYVTAIPITTKYGKVYARPNLVRLPSVYKKHLKKAEGVSTYSIVDNVPIAFSLIIHDEGGSRLPKVENKITKSIEKLGYTISENSELTLDGTVDVISEKEVEGTKGIQYMVTSELSMFMIVKSTQEKVASFTSEGKGLSPKNQQKAIEASHRKLNIKKKNLAGMLSEAEEQLERVFELKAVENLNKGKTLYDQGKLTESIGSLALVTHGEEHVKEASGLIKTIKEEINRKEAARIKRIQEEKEKQRALELEKARLTAETERAKMAAEVEKAQLMAQEAEALARIEEAKVAMEQVRAGIANIEEEKLRAKAALAITRTEADKVKENVVAYITKTKTNGDKVESKPKRLNRHEKNLVGDWIYLASVEIMSGDENYSGAGRILSLGDNHTFSEGSSSGQWKADSDNLSINDFEIPYVINNDNLILGFTIGSDSIMYIYQSY